MSNREINNVVSLVSYLLIGGYTLVNWLQMYQKGGLVPSRVFSLWVIVIVATIIVNIAGNILTYIMLSILHAIKTGTDAGERFIDDERDRLIGLKGTQVSYITFSMGVCLAMLTFILGEPPLMMFSLIIFSSIAAEIIGSISQVYRYRRGF